MIVSHQHRFIFIKSRKTAGTSLEIALSKFCGPDDIITPIGREDELLRRQLGYRGPQNFSCALGQYSARDWLKVLRAGKRKAFYNHMAAAAAKRLLGEKIWRDYFKFTIERNPWDKVVSRYYWDHRRPTRPSFHDYVMGEKFGLASSYELYNIDGELAVDRVLRYENLAAELDFLMQRLELQERPRMPNAKSGFRLQGSYREMFSDEARRAVEVKFAREIAAFGYSF
jgi:hypothetical protein